MDAANTGQRRERRDPLVITVPRRTLLVLCGPAGSGKSTFAQRFIDAHKDQDLHPTTIVSSDYCRALVCDDEANQQVNRDTFDLFYYIIHKRMFQGRFTIADSTALQSDARYRMIELAQRHHYHTCLLVFNTLPAICLQRDKTRQRSVGEQVITYHTGLLQQALRDIPHEGWHQVQVLGEQNTDVKITIAPN